MQRRPLAAIAYFERELHNVIYSRFAKLYCGDIVDIVGDLPKMLRQEPGEREIVIFVLLCLNLKTNVSLLKL